MELVHQVLSVLLVFALLGAALWSLRRGGMRTLVPGRWRQTGAQAKSVQSLERLALSPQHSLHLVQVDGRQLLVATHPQGCTLLTEMARGAGA
jgi:flagellar biogenesis protein FliO